MICVEYRAQIVPVAARPSQGSKVGDAARFDMSQWEGRTSEGHHLHALRPRTGRLQGAQLLRWSIDITNASDDQGLWTAGRDAEGR